MVANTAHIHQPPQVHTRHVRVCPTRCCRRRFVTTHALWYDSIPTCLTRGDAWTVDGLVPRPFQRGWRKTACTRARTAWVNAVARSECEQWLQADLATRVADHDTATEAGPPATPEEATR